MATEVEKLATSSRDSAREAVNTTVETFGRIDGNIRDGAADRRVGKGICGNPRNSSGD